MSWVHGTDPIEGSSLAISILEEFYNKDCLTISTTHYPEIKNYCLVHTGFENASSDFDLESLKPTYKLLIGIPGKSNAFSISKKLGLDEKIIKRATNYINSNDISIEELLKSIYDDKSRIQQEKEEAEKNLVQVELLRKSYETKYNNLKEKEVSIIEKAKLEARKLLEATKLKVNTAIQEIDNMDKHSLKDLNNIRNSLNASIKETVTISSSTNKQMADISEKEIYTGMPIIIKNLNQNGIITSLVNKSSEVQVQIGSVKMMVNLSNIAKANITNSVKEKSNSISSYKTDKARSATTEINVIGYNVEEAIFVIDKYLDDSSLAKLQTVRIVHGKGTGILRKGIHNFLKTNSHVKSFRLGTYGEGEMRCYSSRIKIGFAQYANPILTLYLLSRNVFPSFLMLYFLLLILQMFLLYFLILHFFLFPFFFYYLFHFFLLFYF